MLRSGSFQRIFKQSSGLIQKSAYSIFSYCPPKAEQQKIPQHPPSHTILQHKFIPKLFSTSSTPVHAKAVVNGPPLSDPNHQEIVDLTCELMTSIYEGDYATYVRLCDENMTCFEPETNGNLISGMPFHKYYFDHLLTGEKFGPMHTTLANPHVVMLGEDSAYICYNFLIQVLKGSQWVTIQREETRIWKKKDGAWKSLHFHKSIL